MSIFERLRRYLAPYLNTLLAIALGFVVVACLLSLAGYDPLSTFGVLFRGALGHPKYVTNVIIKATPILLTGVAVAFAFQTGLFDIGAEGQYIAGTIAATIAGVCLDLPMLLQVPLVLAAGVLGGALFGAFVGWLKAKHGIHEVISSIMCNWIALYLCNFIVGSSTFHKPNSTTTFAVNPSSYAMILGQWKLTDEGIDYLVAHPFLRDVLLKCDLNVGFLVAVLVAIAAGQLLARTKLGYELRVVGHNQDAARFAGINVPGSIVSCMTIAGGICGLAGALTITGTNPHALALLSAHEGYGFNGMSVAFIAGCSTIGCIPASLLFSALIYGGMSVQQILGVPSEIISIMIGTIVLFTAIPSLAPRIGAWLGLSSSSPDVDAKEA